MSKKKKEKKDDENLKSLEKEVSDLKNIAARAQADLVNYRNRMKTELLEIEKKTIKNFALKILSVIDDIDLAIDNSKESSKELLEDGLKNIRNKFESLLKQKNINIIEENDNFDPYIHEAILKTESDSEDGSILNVLRNGYVMNDEVIRPTQVEIAENFKKKNNDKEK
ncbi:MAG: nucleotide exchange factor GrpE [Chloroflexota bacterium]|nr:nucleotide exchange factor GrpE [Chloroflexota bacterium]